MLRGSLRREIRAKIGTEEEGEVALRHRLENTEDDGETRRRALRATPRAAILCLQSWKTSKTLFDNESRLSSPCEK